MSGKTERGLSILFLIALVAIVGFGLMRSCTSQSLTFRWGGETDLYMEPNQKLQLVTWKEDSLWILAKDMTDEDVAEDYSYYEKDPMGMLEGCVHIHEVKMTEEELAEHNRQIELANDYYDYTNYDEEGKPIFIEYNADTDTYIELKPYTRDEDGNLIDKK